MVSSQHQDEIGGPSNSRSGSDSETTLPGGSGVESGNGNGEGSSSNSQKASSNVSANSTPQPEQPLLTPQIHLQLPKGKEKKRVGFLSDRPPAQTGGPPAPQVVVTPDGQEFAAQDYFSSPINDNDFATTPPHRPFASPAKRDSFNRDEITAALAEILRPELHDQGSSAHPVRPRPVLRKNTTVPDPQPDMLKPPHRSEVEARNRADKLAHAVGTSSAGASRRSSFAGNDTDSGDEVTLNGNVPPVSISRDFEAQEPDDSNSLRARRKSQQVANDLVRNHTRRISAYNALSRPQTALSTNVSGATTPIPHDLEYVPRPDKYRGGILGNLLKLYNAEENTGATTPGGSSTMTTPSQTPNRTPTTTPPTSRPGTPKSDKDRGRHRGFRSGSTSRLMESSFMFAVPGAAKEVSEAAHKLREEKDKTKRRSRSRLRADRQKLEEFRITKHIAEIISRHRYLLKLCNALMMYGAPTHRLEAYMRMSARVLGIEGQFMYLPGTMIISFDDSNTHTTEMKIVRSNAGVDLGKLRDVHEVYKEVVHDLISADEATSRLTDIINRKNKYPTWLRVVLFGIASATVAPFGFEGRYIDMPIAFILGCIVGILQLYIAPTNELYANVFEITAALVTSFFARVFGSIHDGELFCFSSLAQSSIALILPGYMVLCASLELQSHSMVSGSVRMVYALIYSLFLGYGITIGSVIYGYMDKDAVSAIHCRIGPEWYSKRPDPNYYILFVLPFTLCLCAINQAKFKQLPVMVVISLAGYCVNSFSSRYFSGNTTLSNSLGALCIGVLANLYSRMGRVVQNKFLDIWEKLFEPRIARLKGNHRRLYSTEGGSNSSFRKDPDPEMGLPAEKPAATPQKHTRRIGYGLAAAAMLPAIFVQVPSALAVGGSLLSGVASADQITRNETLSADGQTVTPGTQTADLNSTAFNVLLSVVQVAISISVGLSLSALIVYPFGKRRSGLFSF
ncbi:hypothetical protein QBC32DRAFT_214985 [Pseudoneurospora amorphoporcata]|uniref:Threonine/serine exporter-like N-terminal domain-containing protein n=1 Tax=Pseudoneurospora amorphoporcata TaxID=241081 RepID=A0AAN6SEM7_9PEZI|nr:hypothetical protein QBC32DRAFT_214985 [Pseudoneurospora amorphoporcata]